MFVQLVFALAAGLAFWAHKEGAGGVAAPGEGASPKAAKQTAPPPAGDRPRFYEDAHKRRRAEMDWVAESPSPEEKLSDQFFARSSALLASSTICAWVYPPLLLWHIPALFYVSLPRYRDAREDIIDKKEITINVVGAVSSVGSLAYAVVYPSMVVVFAASGWLYAMTSQLVMRTQDRTRRNLANLFGEQPRQVWVVHEGVEIEAPFESVVVGDILVVDAGQMIPIDGIIQSGMASIDEHMLTGESRPAEKSAGDRVFAATLVMAGRIYVRIEKTGRETAAAQIGEILKDTSSFTASARLRGQSVADRYARPTMGLGALALPLSGPEGALAVLGSGIGNSMRLLGPISVLSFLQLTARRGILIKDGRALEQISKIDTLVFDKTGTLTLKQPAVGEIHPLGGHTGDSVLAYAAAAEFRQTHPIAKAILQAAQARGLEPPPISEAAYDIGYGIKVAIAGQAIRVGSDRFMAQEGIAVPPPVEAVADQARAQGHTLVYVAIDGALGGVIEMRPTVRPEARRVIDRLRRAGLDIHILSGDHEKPTRVLAEQLGVEHYFAETLPEQKAGHIARLQAEGRFVCFVGDGINDSIALKKAQVSVSLSGASTIATDTAQIILMDQTLNQLDELFDLAEAFEANMDRDLLSSAIPGGVIIVGAFSGVIGLTSSIALYWVGAMAGLANALFPLFSAQEEVERRG